MNTLVLLYHILRFNVYNHSDHNFLMVVGMNNVGVSYQRCANMPDHIGTHCGVDNHYIPLPWSTQRRTRPVNPNPPPAKPRHVRGAFENALPIKEVPWTEEPKAPKK